jgi:hypothetical protein
METLLEVGLVEALAAGVFVGFCALISFLLRSNHMTETELTEMLHQISEPESADSQVQPSSSLSYRGNRYESPKGFLQVNDPDAEIHVESPQSDDESVRIPDSVVKMTYRGVAYIKPCFKQGVN